MNAYIFVGFSMDSRQVVRVTAKDEKRARKLLQGKFFCDSNYDVSLVDTIPTSGNESAKEIMYTAR